jgi:hypothetical protein
MKCLASTQFSKFFQEVPAKPNFLVPTFHNAGEDKVTQWYQHTESPQLCEPVSTNGLSTGQDNFRSHFMN